MKKTRFRMGIVAALLVAIVTMAMPVTALSPLKATDFNVNALKYHVSWTPYAYGSTSGYLMPYYAGAQYLDIGDSNHMSRKDIYYQGYTIMGTTMTDYAGTKDLWGECVSFVKSVSHNQGWTGNWRRGSAVLGWPMNVQPGTAIATFQSDGTYNCCGSNHVAIFKGYVSLGGIMGIEVWDQNFLPPYKGYVAKHVIWQGGTGSSNANNYYVVTAP